MNDPQVQVDYEPLELPEGVRHYELSGFAETWVAYDALTREGGWLEHYRDGTVWKTREVDGRRMLVFAPHRLVRSNVPIDTSGDFGEPDRDEDRPF